MNPPYLSARELKEMLSSSQVVGLTLFQTPSQNTTVLLSFYLAKNAIQICRLFLFRTGWTSYRFWELNMKFKQNTFWVKSQAQIWNWAF